MFCATFSRISPLSVRLKSTTSSRTKYVPKFAFPKHANASPREIFHLPHNATQPEIKARYIELVRQFHPDAPSSRKIAPEEAHTRFQAIGTAYETLRGKGKNAQADAPDHEGWFNEKAHQARNKAVLKRRRALDEGGDDRWKDRLILGLVIFSIGGIMWQVTRMRHKAIRDGLVKPQPRQRVMSPEEEAMRKLEEKSLSAED